MELKNTKARKHILGVLKTVKTPLTAEEVYIKVKDFKINMSTVYRSLNTFTKSNLVKKEISNIDKKAYYSLLSTEHYHILECTTCHKKIRINYCPFKQTEKKIYNQFGFKIDDENSVVYGTCKDCLKKNK